MPDTELFEQVLAATREQTRAEQERIALEQSRLQKEAGRMALQQQNRDLLETISSAMSAMLSLYTTRLSPDVSEIAHRTELIEEFIKTFILKLAGDASEKEMLARLESLLRDIGSARSDMRLQIRADRDVSTGDIIDGNKTTSIASCNWISNMADAVSAARDGDVEKANSILGTLPADAIDVAMAALESPIAGIGMALKKVAGKLRIVSK